MKKLNKLSAVRQGNNFYDWHSHTSDQHQRRKRRKLHSKSHFKRLTHRRYMQLISKTIMKPATFRYKSKTASLPSSLLKQLDSLSLGKNLSVNDESTKKSGAKMGTSKDAVISDSKTKFAKNSFSQTISDSAMCKLQPGTQCFHSIAVNRSKKVISLRCKSDISTEQKSSFTHFQRTSHWRKSNHKFSLKLKSRDSHTQLSNKKSASSKTLSNSYIQLGCGYQAHVPEADVAVNELASYIENYFFLPKKMSSMAEMMYT